MYGNKVFVGLDLGKTRDPSAIAVVLCDNSPGGLVSQIANRLNEGWQLQGGVSVSPIDDAKYARGTLLYSQAMTLPSAG